MNSNVWIKRTAVCVIVLTLIGVLLAGPSQAWADNRPAASRTNDLSRATELPRNITTGPGDEKWSSQFELGADNWVFSSVFAPDGDLYIGGIFQHVAGIAASNIARWDAGTNKWSSLGVGTDGSVAALMIYGGTLYVGGGFTHAGGITVNAIAAYNLSSGTWSGMGSGMASSTIGPGVAGLAADDSGNIYAGGAFDTAGGAPAGNIAMWNGSYWSAMGTSLGNPMNGLIKAIAVNGSEIYAGGSVTGSGNLFQYVGGYWHVVGGDTNGQVTSLAINGSSMFVAGSFTAVNQGTQTANNIARWDIGTSTWSALGSGLTGLHADAIAFDGLGNMYVTGDFTAAGGASAHSIAKWNGATWSTLADPAIIGDGIELAGYSLSIHGSDVYVTGNFTQAGGYPAQNIARWDAANQHWYAPGSTVNGTVVALLVNNDFVYVGGNFTTAGGLPARSIARWSMNTNTWEAVSSDPLMGCNGFLCSGPVVNALAINGSDIYVGGNFNSAGGATLNNIARLNNGSWNALGNGLSGCSPIAFCAARVNTIVPDGSGVTVGGSFINAGPTIVNHIARWDGSTWQLFTDSGHVNTGTDGPVLAIATDGSGNYYFGGGFNVPAANLVYFDGFDWYSGFSAPNAAVGSIVWLGRDLYIGGQFTNAAGSGANYIAVSRNGSDWQALGNSLDDWVSSISQQGNKLVVTGAFSQSGILGVAHIATWDMDSQSWSNLGTGSDDIIYAAAASPGYTFVGGVFGTLGGKISNFFGRYGGSQVFLPLAMR